MCSGIKVWRVIFVTDIMSHNVADVWMILDGNPCLRFWSNLAVPAARFRHCAIVLTVGQRSA